MLPQNCQLLARYNQWMNDKLYACASQLSEEDLHKDMGAFFGSVLGTLNHLVVADIIWMKRFADHPARFLALAPLSQIERPDRLDAIVHNNLEALYALRQQLDSMILGLADEVTGESLNTRFAYRNMKGDEFDDRLMYPLQHFFNHQTHHRGQLTTLLNQLGIEVGVTDLLMVIRDSDLP
ncbi:MAG: damage-inducible protein DinB [Proteobacteria bacterium]|nr:damage-inducible protein DinB [Pseudomonadota bacterium]MDA0928370.1 damage-inducible protein DinB [Pseudomonadota bacterium]